MLIFILHYIHERNKFQYQGRSVRTNSVCVCVCVFSIFTPFRLILVLVLSWCNIVRYFRSWCLLLPSWCTLLTLLSFCFLCPIFQFRFLVPLTSLGCTLSPLLPCCSLRVLFRLGFHAKCVLFDPSSYAFHCHGLSIFFGIVHSWLLLHWCHSARL